MAKPVRKEKGIPHPDGVYHRYTWMGNGWKPRSQRKGK